MSKYNRYYELIFHLSEPQNVKNLFLFHLEPYYQAVKLYRNGNFEWCTGEWHDLKMCLESKVASSPEEKEVKDLIPFLKM